MAYTVSEKRIPSTDGIHNLYTLIYLPEGEPKALLQIVHGMTEHIDRYRDFMAKAADAGYLCFGHDHLGHGNTAENEAELGYFAKKGGSELLIDDAEAVAKDFRAAYPDKKSVLFGHSMGSFIVRLAAQKYPEGLDALIISGTGGPQKLAPIGRGLAAIIRFFCGEHHLSPLLENIMFGAYNERTEKMTGRDWLTRDGEIVRRYEADPFCTFRFTVSALADLIDLNIRSNRKGWFDSLPKALPVLLASGENDPVGDYGKGVRKVYDNLMYDGMNDVTFWLYPDCRHEILNELNRDQISAEILGWINEKVTL